MVVVAILAVTQCTPAIAQSNLLFQHLTVNEGLSQGSVTCILQDSQGFMWFGTQDGLNRYDGYSIRVFKHDPADSTTIGESFIVSITEDKEGTLWIGTVSHNDILNRFDPVTESFTQYPRDSVDLRGARENNVNASYEEPSGVRWSGTIGGGLKRYDPRTGTTRVFKHDPSDPGSLTSDNVHSVYGDRLGTIWVGTREGLEQFNRETESFIHWKHDPSDPKSLSSNWIWPIYEDRSGILWVGTLGGGLNRFDRATGTFIHYRNKETDPMTCIRSTRIVLG
jgi:ligand-binding sensor domain-containing protein